MLRNILPVIILLLTSLAGYAQPQPVTNYLHASGSIAFNAENFHLAWSSHPSPNYTKHEYLRTSEALDSFKKMILLEVQTGATVGQVAKAKIAELERLKKANPVINYKSYEKHGEVLLDFIISASTPDGKYLTIIERNVYRYASYKDKNGLEGVELFGISERAYGDDIMPFLEGMKKTRLDAINELGAAEMPTVTIPE